VFSLTDNHQLDSSSTQSTTTTVIDHNANGNALGFKIKEITEKKEIRITDQNQPNTVPKVIIDKICNIKVNRFFTRVLNFQNYSLPLQPTDHLQQQFIQLFQRKMVSFFLNYTSKCFLAKSKLFSLNLFQLKSLVVFLQQLKIMWVTFHQVPNIQIF
jgi:hypothetical protein